MKDSDGEVLYIGKAKDLRSRVRSYFSGGDERFRIKFMLEQVICIDALVTEDERQALVLEADLVRKYKPHYNIRLKDDKSHLHVRIDLSVEWPKLELVRVVKDDGAKYIGPFVFSAELKTVLEVLKRITPLRSCTDRTLHNRIRPCLEYQIKRCVAPCCLEVDRIQYLDWVEQAIQILKGKNEEVIKKLTQDMEKASLLQCYEDAAVIRDRIDILKKMKDEQSSTDFGVDLVDAIGIYNEGGKIEISILLVRNGRLVESYTYGCESDLDPVEVLGATISQFYSDKKTFPNLILIPLALEDLSVRGEMYSEKSGKTVSIVVPERGSKHRLLELAHANAKQNHEARYNAVDKIDRILNALQFELGLDQAPRNIECVDISHFQGSGTVGAIVSFCDGKPNKNNYRCFHLSQEINDDFASMREVLHRHLTRSMEEGALSDLIVVDGGRAQLSQAIAVREELGIDRPIFIGLAKKRRLSVHYRSNLSDGSRSKKPERIFLENKEDPLILNPRSESLLLLEKIRDEAHRFVILFHRKTRQKKAIKSKLDNIPGIGKIRKVALLREFGSVDAIAQLSVEEICRRSGLTATLARRLLKFSRAK
jgi:excinuclease ABC subunit C